MQAVTVIIVSYNVRAVLRQCLASLYAGANVEEICEVILVDNGSNDGTVDMVREYFPRVILIANLSNAGFTAANNQALKIATGDYILFLNPDTEVGHDVLPRLRKYLAENAGIGVVGPCLRFPDGQPQSSRRRFPTLRTALLESTVAERWWPNSRAVQRYRMQDVDGEAIHEVDWLVGACFLTRRKVIDQVGGFDERFFMYSEELDWCRRVRTAGWRVVYFPGAEVIHHEGKSSEQNLERRSISFNESKCRYFEKYYGWRIGFALRVYLLANTAYDLLVEVAKLGLGHRRDLRRIRILALAHIATAQTRRLLTRAGRP